MSQNLKSKKHVCNTCGQAFGSQSSQRQHSRAKHPHNPTSRALASVNSPPSVEPAPPLIHRGTQYSNFSTVEQNALQGRLWALCHSEQRLRKERYSLPSDIETPNEACLPNGTHLPSSNMGQPVRKSSAIVLDCEMAGTSDGGEEVIQMTVVDFLSGSVLQNCLVNPSRPIVDWRQDITGINFASMQEAITRNEALNGWEAARSELWRFVDKETIIIGQSVQHDLKVLHVCHERIIDSAIITADAVLGKNSRIRKRWGLQALCQELLGIQIRKPSPLDGRRIHDALEDALAARELVLLCLRTPDKLDLWATKARRDFFKGNGSKKAPRAGGSRRKGAPGRKSVANEDEDEDGDEGPLRWEDVVDWETWPKSPPDSD